MRHKPGARHRRQKEMGWSTGFEPATARSTIWGSNQAELRPPLNRSAHYVEPVPGSRAGARAGPLPTPCPLPIHSRSGTAPAAVRALHPPVPERPPGQPVIPLQGCRSRDVAARVRDAAPDRLGAATFRLACSVSALTRVIQAKRQIRGRFISLGRRMGSSQAETGFESRLCNSTAHSTRSVTTPRLKKDRLPVAPGPDRGQQTI